MQTLFNLFDLLTNRGAPEKKKTLATLNKTINFYTISTEYKQR